MKSNDSPHDWKELPSLGELNSEDDKMRTRAEEKAFSMLHRIGMAWIKGTTSCSHDEAENAVVTAIQQWFVHVRKL